ncbi:hypothetical protein N665_0129s0007 [Sinapis alba]|nr:hypothetical protein N665_0129s0007 [Sinapis alba]
MLCSTERNSRLVVWNPCTGQTRSIKPRTCYSYDDAYALGYSGGPGPGPGPGGPGPGPGPGGHSYKILRRFYSQNDKKVVLGEMYDFSSDSWRVLLDDDSFPLLGYSVNRNGVSLKGDAYFVAPRDKVVTDDAFLITKFDFTTETLVRLPLPFQILYPQDKAFLSVVRDEKISLLHIEYWVEGTSIWVTNKIDDETKDLSWRSDVVLKTYCYRHNLYFESFLFDDEEKNKVAVLSCVADLRDKFETRIYIADEYMDKQVYEATISTFDWPFMLFSCGYYLTLQ